MSRAAAGTDRVLVLGDSHIHAIKEALEFRNAPGPSVRMEARRLFKTKCDNLAVDAVTDDRPVLRLVRGLFKRVQRSPEGSVLGDISLEGALKLAAELRPNDLLVSAIGGNQHAVFSTIQHPRPFDFLLQGVPSQGVRAGAEIVPFRALYDYFRAALRKGDGEMIAAFRNTTRARMVHLLSPPPKRKNNWIEHYHDTFFASEGIGKLGVSSPDLRIKFWRLQNQALESICAELGIEVIGPPPGGCDADGFLARDCYAGDATHANLSYGRLVVDQLEARFGGVETRAFAAQ